MRLVTLGTQAGLAHLRLAGAHSLCRLATHTGRTLWRARNPHMRALLYFQLRRLTTDLRRWNARTLSVRD